MESKEELKKENTDSIEEIENELSVLFMQAVKEANSTMAEYNDMVRTFLESQNLNEYLTRARITLSRIEPGTRGEKIYNLAKKYFEMIADKKTD